MTIRVTWRAMVKRVATRLLPGIPSAPECGMDAQGGDGEERRRESRRLVAVSRQLVEATRARLQNTRQHLDKSRNAIQAFWLGREVRRRLHRKPDD
jgi:hypothetical protein